MNTLRSLLTIFVTIFVTIWGSIFSSRSKRNVMGAVLAVLCVAVFVAGALLVQKQGLTTDTKQRSRVGSLRAPKASARSDRGSTVSPAEEKQVSTQSDAQQSRVASNDDNAQNKTRSSGREPGKQPVRIVVPEAPPVFSVMRNDEVKKKLADATKPRASDAESADEEAAGELADASRTSGDEDQEEARERMERAEKRRLAAARALASESERPKFRGGITALTVGAQAQAPEASPDTVATTFDLPKVAPSEFNGDVRDLRPVPINLAQREVDFDELLQYPATPIGPPSPETKVPIIAAAPMPSPIRNFDGLSRTESVTGGVAGAGFPPDVNGDVGLNHYIISVNDAYGIYDKVTGARVAAFTENSLFSGGPTGTLCDTNSFGDPVVLYDQLADRWILTNFAFIANGATGLWNPPLYQCFAVSKTSNPVTGGWWLYAVRMDTSPVPTNTLPDYGKFGIWNDGCLYMGANGFSGSTGGFVGNIFASFKRSDMESGLPLTAAIGFSNLGSSLFPSNLLGKQAGQLPPAGTPNYFVRNSSTTGFQVRTFTPGANCGGGGTMSAATTVSHASGPTAGSVPQPNDSTHALDSLSDRIMQKVQYRKVGAAESLWVIRTVQPSGAPTAPQWAQINVSGGTISTTPVQQQIFAPDATLYRWMGSVAADSQGNMAIGYSTSNATSPNFPSIAYAGRFVGDPLNQLPQTETQLIAGGGSQVNTCGGAACHRWGDYSSMSIDPADDCTFWYAQEYYDNQTSGNSGNWHTRIGSFKFATCGACSTITGTVSGGGTICNGSSSTVSVDVTGGTPPYTVKLTNNAQVQTGSAVQTHFDFTVSPTTTTSYQVDIVSSHDNGSCPLSNSGSGTVTVNQPPTPATVGGNQTICALGTTTGLGGNNPSSGTGTWTVVSGGTGTFGNIHTGNTTFTHTTGTGPVVLRWTISNSPCTDSTAQVTITVNQPPTPATVGGNQTICALGTTAGLGGNTPASGTGTWTVFSGGTGTFGNIHTGNTTFTHTSGVGPVVLRWTISNAPCTDSSAQLSITITPQPTATTGGNQAVCVNGTTAGLGGNTPSVGTGMWSVVSGGTGTFSNVNAPNCLFTHTGGTGPVVVRWTVTNPPCTNATADASITINQPPATPMITPTPASVCAGSTGNTASAPVSSGYMWSITNGIITSASNIQAITYIAGATGNVTLNLTVTNAAGCSASNSLMVTIKPIGLDQDHLSFPGNGGTGTVNVSPSDLTCAWTAAANVPFIHITSGSAGVGTGSVQFTVDGNPASNIRSDTILIGGQTFTVYQGIDFIDVPPTDQFYSEIGKLSARGVTLGCNPVGPLYCPNDPVLREQMSAFLMRALGEFNPPMPGSQRFGDVPPSNQFYNFIERLAVLGITLGCQPGNPPLYCPTDAVKREQMSAFILRALGEFNPPIPAMQRFGDVPPTNDFYAFIDRLAVLGITNGCQPGNPPLFCPNDNVTRGQMAAFLARAFNL